MSSLWPYAAHIAAGPDVGAGPYRARRMVARDTVGVAPPGPSLCASTAQPAHRAAVDDCLASPAKRRLGAEADQPHRIKYKPLVRA